MTTILSTSYKRIESLLVHFDSIMMKRRSAWDKKSGRFVFDFIGDIDGAYLLREGFKKKKIVEYSTKGLIPPPRALSGKNFY